MQLDLQSLLSDDQAITATAVSTNVYDRGENQLDEGWGTPKPLLIQVTEAFNNLTSLRVDLQTADDIAFTAPVTAFSQTIPLSGLTLGARASTNAVPYNTTGRYMRLNYTVTGTAPTTGKITAGFTFGNDETPPFV